MIVANRLISHPLPRFFLLPIVRHVRGRFCDVGQIFTQSWHKILLREALKKRVVFFYIKFSLTKWAFISQNLVSRLLAATWKNLGNSNRT
jgi:hypothetical protein